MQNFAVAVKGIIKNTEGEYLLLYKSDVEDVNPNSFDIPGGRIKFGEKLEDALIREIQEEVGLQVRIEKISRTWGFVKDDLHLVGVTFLVSTDDKNIQLSEEHTSYYRKTKDAILNGDFPDWLKKEFLNV